MVNKRDLKRAKRRRLRLIPRARLNDNVERTDNSRFFGRVVKRINKNRVLVEWSDKEGVEIREEQIKDLALVRRI